MDAKQRYRAFIAGREYTIIGNRPVEHLDAVVDLVNSQFEQLSEMSPNLSLYDKAILMSINAVSDQILKEQEIVDLEDKVKELEEKLAEANKKNASNQKIQNNLKQNSNNKQTKNNNKQRVPFRYNEDSTKG